MKNNNSIIVLLVVVVVIIIGLVAWMSYRSSYVTNEPSVYNATSTETGQVAQTLTLNTASDPNLGKYLVDPNGMTLYTYSGDKSGGSSSCTGQCAQTWPPYTVSSTTPVYGSVEVTGKIATTTRSDDKGTQVSYKGLPLYYYSKDSAPGDVSGKSVSTSWKVAKP